jgi:DUF1680 family protein
VRLSFCAFLLAAPAALAAVAPAVPDRFIPAPFESQRISGMLGERMQVNLEKRLLQLDEKAVIAGFEHRPGEQDWIGEHAGKFLDAAVKTYEYSHDERLKTLMDRVARELIAAQLPDGYLGTYTDDKRWTSWDVWVHKYDLIGLLSYYQLTGYQPALDTSRKIGDLLCRTFGTGPRQRDIIRAGEHVGMAATSVLEPMVALYRTTGEKRYLDFCRYIVSAWDQPNGPKIISSLEQTGSVYRTANAKAYEMMSNLVGLAELYRMTGEPRYLRAVQTAWDDVAARRLYVSGTASSHEHFTADRVLPGEDISDVGEGCVTVTWLQLTWQLLRLTGDVKYAEQLEHTVYNQLLAAQDPGNGNICYFTPLDGRKNATPGINCCVSSEPRGISMIPQLAWGTRGDAAAILFYTPGEVRLPQAAISEETTYPSGGHVSLRVKPAGASNFPLLLRVPAWTARFTATVDGRVYRGSPGQFLSIDRAWKDGDRVDIDMDMTVHVVDGAPSYPGSVAILRGPQLLALDETANPGLADLQAAGPISKTVQLTEAAAKLPVEWIGHEAWSMPGVVAGKRHDLILVPFADAREYRVWLRE